MSKEAEIEAKEIYKKHLNAMAPNSTNWVYNAKQTSMLQVRGIILAMLNCGINKRSQEIKFWQSVQREFYNGSAWMGQLSNTPDR